MAVVDIVVPEEVKAPLRTLTLRLSHAETKGLAPIAKVMLGARGAVQVDPRTNSLIVTGGAASAESVTRTFEDSAD